MELKKVRFPLPSVKKLITEKRQNCRLTTKAEQTAHSIGYSKTQVLEAILQLEAKDFFKSMNEYRNHRAWQDVYKKRFGNINIYIKLKIIQLNGEELLVLSFKRDEQK